MSTTISVAEWLDELQSSAKGEEGFQTVDEMRRALMKRTGRPCSPLRVRDLLREAQAAGRLEMRSVLRTRLDGLPTTTTGYRIAPRPKGPARPGKAVK